ncbi:MAG: S8 family serine peptidase, partial [Oscillospiraceae bacterium]|nr:S8 family serine peptidase [Oscillospiraceae bacterium]
SFSAASYSQRNSSVYVTAPGTSVISTSFNDTETEREYTYRTGNGTSFATPMVTAFIAAAKSIYPGLTVRDAFDIVRESAEDIGDEGYDTTYGYGVINMKKGIDYLMRTKDIDIPAIEPTYAPTEPPDVPTEPPYVPTGTPDVPTEPPYVPTGTPTDAPTGIPKDKPENTQSPPPDKKQGVVYITENMKAGTISLRAEPADNREMPDVLIVAFYDEGGGIEEIEICNISLAYDDNVVYNIKGAEYKVMVWKELDSMTPVDYLTVREYT